jgi:hypothetical protein
MGLFEEDLDHSCMSEGGTSLDLDDLLTSGIIGTTGLEISAGTSSGRRKVNTVSEHFKGHFPPIDR